MGSILYNYFYIMIILKLFRRLIYPTFKRIFKYILFITLVYFIHVYIEKIPLLETILLDIIKPLILWTIKGIINVYKIDIIAWIIVTTIIWFIVYYIYILNIKWSKYDFLVKDIIFVVWDLFYFIKSILEIFIKYIFRKINKKEALENLDFLIFSWEYGVSFFELTKLERKILNDKDIFQLKIYIFLSSFTRKNIVYKKNNTNKNHIYYWYIKNITHNYFSYTVKIYKTENFDNKILDKLNDNYLKSNLWLDSDTYIRIDNLEDLVITISFKDKYYIEDYIEKFSKKFIYFWISNWNIISRALNVINWLSLAVYGERWSGKSSFIESILIAWRTLESMDFIVADFKWNLINFDVDWIKYSRDIKSINNSINHAHNILKERIELFSKHGCRDLNEFNEISKEKLKITYLVIEEYESLIWEVKWEDDILKNIETKLWSIIRLGRSLGVLLLITTQKSLSSVIWSTNKDNLDVVAFKSIWNSKRTLFPWENLPINLSTLKKWEAVIFEDNKFIRFRSFYVSKKQLEIFNKKYKRNQKLSPIQEFYNYCIDKNEISFSKFKNYISGNNITYIWNIDKDYKELIKDKLSKNELIKLNSNKLEFTWKTKKFI